MTLGKDIFGLDSNHPLWQIILSLISDFPNVTSNNDKFFFL